MRVRRCPRTWEMLFRRGAMPGTARIRVLAGRHPCRVYGSFTPESTKAKELRVPFDARERLDEDSENRTNSGAR